MVLVIDPQISGISGDMLLCSLLDLGADKSKVIDGINSCVRFLPGSTIQTIDFKKNIKHGIKSTTLVLDVDEDVRERRGSDIRQAVVSSVKHLGLPTNAAEFATSCITSLIDAESTLHGDSAESVHLHEASSIDTLVDVVGVAISLDDLELYDEDVICMPVAVGSGYVKFSHGMMSNPASAVLEILRNSRLPICGSSIKEELTTPTGACILKNMKPTPMDHYPKMEVAAIGYGSGKKDFEEFSNTLKMVRGTMRQELTTSHVKILETNIDDVSGEVLGNLVEKLTGLGANDVSIYPGITKKNRPTNLVSVMCGNDSLDDIITAIIDETRTLGIRIRDSERLILPRSSSKTIVNVGGTQFDVCYKTSSFKGKTRFKIEFDDLKAISSSLGLSIIDTEHLIRKEIEQNVV